MHDVSATQQLQKTEVDAESPDRGKRRRIRPCGRADADVSEVHRCVQDVVAELVGAELDLLAGEQCDDLVDKVATRRGCVDRDQRNDDQRAEDAAENSEASEDSTPTCLRVDRSG